MRRRLTLTVLAVTAMVAIAFLLPLAAAIRIVASDRALSVADQEARSLDGVLATAPNPTGVRSFVDQLNADHSGRVATVYLPTGQRLGPDIRPPASELTLAGRGRAFTAESNGHTRVWVAVRLPDGVSVGVVSVPSHLLTQGVGEAWLALVGVAVFVVLLAMVLADRLGRSMVRPIVDLGRATRRLRSGDLDTIPDGLPANFQRADVEAALTLYSGGKQVWQSSPVRASRLNADRPGTLPISIQAQTASLEPGRYECQLSLIDEFGRKFAFPREQVAVVAAASSNAANPAPPAPKTP